MACEHFLGGTYPLCTVVQGLMSPSLREMREYCTRDQPSACPLRQRHAASRERIPVETAMVLIGTENGEPVGPLPAHGPGRRAGRDAPSPNRTWRSDSRR